MRDQTATSSRTVAAWGVVVATAMVRCSSPVIAADGGLDARVAEGGKAVDARAVHDAGSPRDTGSGHDVRDGGHAPGDTSGADASKSDASGPDGLAPYSLLVTAPASGGVVSGFVTVTGFAPLMLNVEVWDPNNEHPPLARTTPATDGSFTAIVDTNDLPNGADGWTVWAWDVPPGGTPMHMASSPLPVIIANGASPDGGADTTEGPVGGPGGYTNLLVNDSFGSNKPGANITSASQFNPSTPYGLAGSGWDLWMKGWAESPGVSANVTMEDTYVAVAPTGGPPGFMVSHFEALPTASTSYYFEIRAMTGRGTSSTTWPALWLFSGNDSSANNAQSEIDVMETYTDLAFGTQPNDAGLYVDYFESTSHHEPMSAILEGPFTTSTSPVDLTTSYNVYGCELTLVNGVVIWKIYFNGTLTQTSPDGISWASSPPAMIVGWNPGSSSETPAVLQLDYARVWSK